MVKSAGVVWLFALQVVCHGASVLPTRISLTDHHFLESPKVSQWGEWGDLKHCPSDQVVVGMQLKVHDHQGMKDDTGLNAVKFYCLNPFSTLEFAGNMMSITSLVGNSGEWKKDFMCPTGTDSNKLVAVGFQMRSESSSGVKDDTAGNNLKLICSDLYQKQGFSVLEGDGNGKGEWTQQQVCWPGYAICGMQTQVEMSKSMDTTGLNNMKVRCCRAEAPADENSNATAHAHHADSVESNTSEDSSLSGLSIEKDGNKYQHQFHHSEEGSLEAGDEQELIAIHLNGTNKSSSNDDDNLPQEIARIEPADNSEAHHEEEERASTPAYSHVPDWDAVVHALEGSDSTGDSAAHERHLPQDVHHHHEHDDDHDEHDEHDHEEEEEASEDDHNTSAETTTAANTSDEEDHKGHKPKTSPRFGQIELINTTTIALSKAPHSHSSTLRTLGIGSMVVLYFVSHM